MENGNLISWPQTAPIGLVLERFNTLFKLMSIGCVGQVQSRTQGVGYSADKWWHRVGLGEKQTSVHDGLALSFCIVTGIAH